MKRYVALLLAFVLSIGALAACNSSAEKVNHHDNIVIEDTAAETTGAPEDTTGEADGTAAFPETNAPETNKVTEAEKVTDAPDVTETEKKPETDKAPETKPVTEKETEKEPVKVTEKVPDKIPDKITQKLPVKETEKVTEKVTETLPEDTTVKAPEPVTVPETDEPVIDCVHTKKVITDKVAATCTKAGYSGDTYCADCNTIIKYGVTVNATGHGRTVIRNKKAATTTEKGYTGDTYCTVCGIKTATGKETPKLAGGKPGEKEYTLPSGKKIWALNMTEARKISMHMAAKKTSHEWQDVEEEILRLINIERKKAGLCPLEWYEDAYGFAFTRAVECFTLFDHKRPDGRSWDTVYTEADVLLASTWGENLFICTGAPAEQFKDRFAKMAVDAWMKSPGHRGNILHKNFNQIAIAIKIDGNGATAVQNFFG